MDWWKQYFFESAEAIRIKLPNLNHANWRLKFPPVQHSDGFRYIGFIDNTMFAFCRPGGVMGEGAAAPRVPLEVQQAWWTGWKKLHGMKWQTVVLANGMDLQVYGPLSVRQNDLDTLVLSNIEEDLKILMQEDEIKYKLFGDSAYYDSEIIGTGGGRGMASVRESVEWTYCDVKVHWKDCDYKHVLKLRQQPVAKIIFVCMLLRNAYVCLHGSQSTEYFCMLPPTLEYWLSQGQNKLLPNNLIFSPNYEYEEVYASEDEDIETHD